MQLTSKIRKITFALRTIHYHARNTPQKKKKNSSTQKSGIIFRKDKLFPSGNEAQLGVIDETSKTKKKKKRKQLREGEEPENPKLGRGEKAGLRLQVHLQIITGSEHGGKRKKRPKRVLSAEN